MPAPSELRSRRDALSAQRSSGVARVSYDGKTVDYRSVAEIDRAIEPLHREKQESFCDIGRSPSVLAAEFTTFGFDHLDDPWWHDGSLDGAPYPRESLAAFEARVAAFADWLSARPESCIAVVGHGTFLNCLTGAVFANAQRIEMTF